MEEGAGPFSQPRRLTDRLHTRLEGCQVRHTRTHLLTLFLALDFTVNIYTQTVAVQIYVELVIYNK